MGAVAAHPAWRRAAEALQEAKMRVQDENIRREEMFFLMEQASSAEAAIVEPAFVFIVGTAFIHPDEPEPTRGEVLVYTPALELLRCQKATTQLT